MLGVTLWWTSIPSRGGGKEYLVKLLHATETGDRGQPDGSLGSWVWFALGKSFHLCPPKNGENLKPQPERKTFRQKRRVALVGENCQQRRHQVVYPRAFERQDIDCDLNRKKYASRWRSVHCYGDSSSVFFFHLNSSLSVVFRLLNEQWADNIKVGRFQQRPWSEEEIDVDKE